MEIKLNGEEHKLWHKLCSGEELEINNENLQIYKDLYEKVKWVENPLRITLIARLRNAIGYEPKYLNCSKIPFDTRELAKRELGRIREEAAQYKQKTDKIPIRSYECDRCGKWHLTSQSLLKISNEN